MSTTIDPTNSHRNSSGTQDTLPDIQAIEDYRKLFDISHQGLCVTSMNGEFHHINSFFEQLLRYNRHDFVNNSFASYVYPEDIARTAQAFGVLGENKPINNFENRYVASNGEIRWLRWKAESDLSKGVVYGVAQDITALKHQEEKVSTHIHLFAGMNRVLRDYISGDAEGPWFHKLLFNLVSASSSEYGFLADVIDVGHRPCLRVRALMDHDSNVSHTGASVSRPGEGISQTYVDSLAGYVLKTKMPISSDKPMEDRRGRGPLPGFPKLDSFLGIPILGKNGVLAVVGLGNRPQGYDAELTRWLQAAMPSVAAVFENRMPRTGGR